MYYLLGLSVLAASANSVFLHKAKLDGKGEIFRFNLLCSLVWCVVLLGAKGGSIELTPQVLLWGVVYGVIQSLFILFKAAAMSSGSVSVTTLIGNSSLLISLLVSLMLWQERVSILDIFGLALLLAAILLCTYKKDASSYTKGWKFYVIFFLIFAAGVGITFKAFSKSGNGAYTGDMMFVSSAVMAVSFFIMCLSSGGVRMTKEGRRGFLSYALVSGLLSCLYNRLNISLSGALDAIVFFPVFNGGVVLLSALLSVLICRERLSLRQWVGLAMGTAAICIIGIL